MILSEYRSKDLAVSNHFRPLDPLGNGIVALKPRGFLVGFEFRGPDTLGTSWHELRARCDDLAAIFAQFDSSWCFHITMQRVRGGTYPRDGHWPDVVTYLLDSARRQRYEADGDHYLSVGRLWASWHPRGHKVGLLDWLYNDRDNMLKPTQKFEAYVASLENALRPYFLDFHRLGTRPHTLLSGEDVLEDQIAGGFLQEYFGETGIIAGDVAMGTRYDTLLAPSWADLKPGLSFDGRHIGVVSLFGYPQWVYPSMLESLRGATFDMRFTTRIIPYSLTEAEQKMHRKSTLHLLTALGLGLFVNKSEDGDATAMQWRQHVHDARKAAKDGVPFAQTNSKVIVFADSDAGAREAERLMYDTLKQLRQKPRIEDASNRFHAYLSSLPGEIDADEILAPPLPLAGSMRIAPLTSLWHGQKEHPDKRFGRDAGPLLMMTTPMREAFAMFLHVGEVGHTLIVMRTGRGKSTLMRAMEVGHLSRYRGARAMNFDIGRSAYKLCRAIGGRHYMPTLARKAQIAYLSGLSDATQFDDVLHRVVQMLELWLDRRIDIHEQADVAQALQSTSLLPRFCLSDVGRHCQSGEVRAVFDKLRDSMLDAYSDGFDFAASGTPYWSFEIGALGIDKPNWTVPFMTYAQDRAFQQFSKSDAVPTLVTMDEGARALKIPRVDEFVERIECETRKNRGQFIFATQSADEILKSSIASVLVEQTPTRISGANRDLVRSNKRLRDQYLQIGYSDEQLDIISGLGEFDVLVSNENGMQVMALAPLAVELALYGGASNEDCDVVDRLIAAHGKKWVSAYLRERRDLLGLSEFAEALDTLRSAWDARENALEEAV